MWKKSYWKWWRKNKIVINEEVALGLFDKVEDSIGKEYLLMGDIYEVIGVTKSQQI